MLTKACFSITLFCLFCLSCTSKDDISCVISTEGNYINRIEYERTFGQFTSETYVYKANNVLDSIKGVQSNTRFYTYNYDAQNKLIEQVTFTTFNKVIEKVFIDSFDYNNSNQIAKKRHYSINLGADLPLSNVDIYIYNNAKLLEKKIYLFKNDTTIITLYHWLNGNLTHTESYDKKGFKTFESFLSYDNKKNYLEKLPFDGYRILTKNNLVESLGKDYVGNWDPIANPMKFQYCYNSQGYPTKIKDNIGNITTIDYKN
jgi:hypothetical protein